MFFARRPSNLVPRGSDGDELPDGHGQGDDHAGSLDDFITSLDGYASAEVWSSLGSRGGELVRTLQVALRVRDRRASVAFYTAVGYELVGEVPKTPLGHLTMLKLPGDDYVSIELVHDPSTAPGIETGLSHIAVQVESLEEIVTRLTSAGIRAEPIASPEPDLRTTHVTDPDGRRIELVQWPPRHQAGLTAADWSDPEENR